MKRFLLFIIISVIIGGSIFLFTKTKNQNNETTYEFSQIKRGNLQNFVSCSGTIETVGSVEVGTQVSGIIEKVFADFNDNVRKNQILAILDSTELALNVKSAKADVKRNEAQFELSEIKYENALEIFEKNLISDYELKETKTDMKMKEASLLSSKVNLEKAINNQKYAIITSPINGKIINRAIEKGQTVSASLSAPTLFLIAEDLTQMEIYAQIDETDIGQVQEGQLANFTIDAFPDQKFSGTVKEIRLQPEVISNVVNYTVVLSADNSEGFLLPGMTATIDIIVEEINDVYLIDNQALSFKPDREIIMQAMQKRREKQPRSKGNGQGMGRRKRDPNAKMLWYLNGDALAFIPVKVGATDGYQSEISGKDITTEQQIIKKANSASKKNKDLPRRRMGGGLF